MALKAAAVGDTAMGGGASPGGAPLTYLPGGARGESSDGFSYPRGASRRSDPSQPARTTRRLLQLQWAAAAERVAAAGLGAAHVAAFLLEEEALETLLLHAPAAATARDSQGRTPLHYATHGSDRVHGLVYLFTPQPFHTWLGRRSRSQREFAPPLPLANLSAEVQDVQLATLSTLLVHGADPAAADVSGTTPLALAAAAAAPVRVLRCLLDGAADGAALLDAVDHLGRPPDQLAAAAGQHEVARWLRSRATRAASAAGSAGSAHGADDAGVINAGSADGADHAWVINAGSADGAQSNSAASPSPSSVDGAHTVERVADDVSGAGAAGGAGVYPPCDVASVAAGALSAQAFYAAYALRAAPVAVRAAYPVDPLPLGALLADFGAAVWTPQLLLPGNATPLGPYLERVAAGRESRPLAFNRPSDPTLAARAFARVRRHGWPHVLSHPKLLSDSRAAGGAGLEMFVGPEGSGLPMHHHGAVWNALLWGRKLWALLPPSRAAFAPAGQHVLDSDWLRAWRRRSQERGEGGDGGEGGEGGEGGGRDGWLFCEQRAGDVLYVPPHWAHATLAHEPSFSVGGFLQDDASLTLHMQLMHAPRGVGSLQNAATLHRPWFELVSRAFSD